MGLFGGPVLCSICGKETGTSSNPKHKAMDGVICNECFRAAGYTRGMVVFGSELQTIKKQIQAHQNKQQELSAFERTRGFAGLLSVDDKHRKWYCTMVESRMQPVQSPIYDFDQIESACIEEDDRVVASTKERDLGRTVVGGVLFGESDAVVGGVLFGEVDAVVDAMTGRSSSVNKISVAIQLKNATEKAIRITVSMDKVKRGTPRYNAAHDTAEEILHGLESILPSEESAPTVADPAAEIRKFKALLDDGIITQDEFDAKKKQLLGL